METPRGESQEGSEEVKSESLTVQNILNGNLECKFLSKSTETKNDVIWDCYLYEIEVPHPLKPGDTWKTNVMIWEPSPANNLQVYEIPETQVTILTSEGEISLSKRKEVEEKVIEILRDKQRETQK